jgi:hypothetical protein
MARPAKRFVLGIVSLVIIGALAIYAFLPTTEPIETSVRKIKIGMRQKEVGAILAPDWIPIVPGEVGPGPLVYQRKRGLWSKSDEFIMVIYAGDPIVIVTTPESFHVSDPRTPWDRTKDYLANKLGW